MKIESAYPGTQGKDGVLSEFKLIDGEGRVVAIEEPAHRPGVNPALGPLVDRSYSAIGCSVDGDGGASAVRMIRIRGNGTFFSSSPSSIREGNWQPWNGGLRIEGRRFGTPEEKFIEPFQVDLKFKPFKELNGKDQEQILTQLVENLSGSTGKVYGPEEDPIVTEKEKGGERTAKLTKSLREILSKRNPMTIHSPTLTGAYLPSDQLPHCH